VLTSGQFPNPFSAYTNPATGKLGDPFPGNAIFPAQGAYVTIPGNMPVTGVMQWNLSYQRQIAGNWVIKANYMGNAGRHILGSIDINQSVSSALGPGGAAASTGNANQRRPTYLDNPTLGQYYADIQQSDPGANSEYHGLILSIERHFSGHYTILSNYGWSHCSSSWDMSAELAGALYQNSLNRAQGERGPCGYDHRQVFNTTVVATSPGVGSSVAKALTKDWQISPIISLYTGNPFQLSDGGKDISLSAQGLDRPYDVLPTQVYTVTPNNDPPLWINPAAFLCAGNSTTACNVFSGQFGNVGRNALYGPGTINFDMAVSRRFTVGERWKLDLRTDFFNFLNHANWNAPQGNVTSAQFGMVTGFSGPRQIQMALKLYF
jgi:hypothetical protein